MFSEIRPTPRSLQEAVKSRQLCRATFGDSQYETFCQRLLQQAKEALINGNLPLFDAKGLGENQCHLSAYLITRLKSIETLEQAGLALASLVLSPHTAPRNGKERTALEGLKAAAREYLWRRHHKRVRRKTLKV